MKILLKPNYNKEEAISLSAAIAEKLRGMGACPAADHSAEKYLGGACEYGDHLQLLTECDMIMAVGGDGTMMRAAKDAMLADKPVIGVNAGRIGFLTQLEACELDKLSLLAEGRYGISQRMLLQGEVTGGEDGSQGVFTAINDIVVSCGSVSGISDIEVRESGRLITRQRADGIIFATPTGSTAYSLSAGGPVADPGLELVIITAICPHAVFRYSLALPVSEPYVVREVPPGRAGLVITADGNKAAVMGTNERLVIRKYEKSVKFIDLGLYDFYGRLNEKLNWTR